MDFYYTYFPYIDFDMVVDAYPNICPHRLEQDYCNWRAILTSSMNNFYYQQLLYHRELLERQFCQEHNIPYGADFLEYAIDRYEYNPLPEYFAQHGYAAHCRAWKEFQQYDYVYVTDGIDFVQWMQLDPLDIDLDALWFNYVINTSQQMVPQLRAMPYRQYLKTRHWRRVRNAMLIIASGRCQNPTCNGHHEAAFWDEYNQLHVHHKSYANRGRERYEDVELLCAECHAVKHQD